MSTPAMGGRSSGNHSPPPSATTYKFPNFESDMKGISDNGTDRGTSYSSFNGVAMPQSRWQSRKDINTNASTYSGSGFDGTSSEPFSHSSRHGRQKSISEAIRTIRTRKGSLGHNAHEIADSLKAPVSPAVIVIIHASLIEIRC